MVAADHSQTLLASVLRVMLHALNTNQVPCSRSFLICWKKESWCSWSFFDPLEKSLLNAHGYFSVDEFPPTPICCPAVSCVKVSPCSSFDVYSFWSWMQNPWETFNANINKIEVQTYIILQNEGIPTCSLMKPQSTARRFASVFWNTVLPQ